MAINFFDSLFRMDSPRNRFCKHCVPADRESRRIGSGRDPLTLVESFDGVPGCPQFQFPADQFPGHGIQVLLEGHVIVDTHADLFPLDILVAQV